MLKRQLKTILLGLSCLFLLSCEKTTYSEIELLELTKKVEPSFDFMTDLLKPKDMESGVKCENYGGEAAGCIYGKRVKVRKVVFIILKFKSQELAAKKAQELELYYKYNWVFDEVAGEPVLEDFVVKAYGAIPPDTNP